MIATEFGISILANDPHPLNALISMTVMLSLSWILFNFWHSWNVPSDISVTIYGIENWRRELMPLNAFFSIFSIFFEPLNSIDISEKHSAKKLSSLTFTLCGILIYFRWEQFINAFNCVNFRRKIDCCQRTKISESFHIKFSLVFWTYWLKSCRKNTFQFLASNEAI